MKNNKLFWQFMKEKSIYFLLFFICTFLFWLVFFLSNITAEVALYPAFLSVIIWALLILYEYLMYRRKHQILEKTGNHIAVTFENLPCPTSLVEMDYQQLLRILLEEKNKQLAGSDKKFRDMQEYITLWAHQIKTPITGMELLLSNLEEKESVVLKERLFEINHYVDMTMEYIRMESLNSDLLIGEYSLLAILRQAVRYYSRTFIAKKISLELQEMDTHVITDEKWLLFVIRQILSNALKYTAGVKYDVEGALSSIGKINIYMKPNADKILVIEDNGSGISPEDLPRIMERGFTGYNGRMDKKATGIGLYLSKQIMDRLQHEITITSMPGVGTKVLMNLSNLTKV